MPNVALTDAGIRGLALPLTGTLTYWDASLKGFGVRVSPKGTKTFIALVGSGQRHKIGRYPLIGLSMARDEARKLLAKKTLGTYEKPNTTTWDTAIERYLKACSEKNRPSTVSEYRRHLARFPFKERRLERIRKRDVAEELEKIPAKGERAHALTAVKIFFSWCAAQGLIDASPVSALKSPPQRQKQALRALSEAELKEVLGNALNHPYPFGPIVALLALTGQRRNEIASLKWENLTVGTMTIPAEAAKNHLAHTFPFGSLVRQVLDGLPDKGSAYLFPASREHVRTKPTTVFNGWGKAKAAFDTKLVGVEPYKLHDLRRTFATTLQRLGVPLEVREKLLNHISGSQAGVAGVYNVYGYEAEMKDAMAKYDAYLVQLLRSGNTRAHRDVLLSKESRDEVAKQEGGALEGSL
ncbi:tyrosine-type recombinase/integrase [Parerythrobacter lacustris]|uniref:Site-specific integrase n=1 Tax=Parerythrobacter lacustris TaxID=2969984 RepID=A0ABT1XPC4_9SPHN|nr:site-specific integrase [Parerythrobacter lacustris]MCR2833501.1 site-specific integrase [Parerythrobacter lacustris]